MLWGGGASKRKDMPQWDVAPCRTAVSEDYVALIFRDKLPSEDDTKDFDFQPRIWVYDTRVRHSWMNTHTHTTPVLPVKFRPNTSPPVINFMRSLTVGCSQLQFKVTAGGCLCPVNHTAHFLGAFPKLRKATISFVMSVCPSVRMEQLGSHCININEIRCLSIFEVLSRKFKFPLNWQEWHSAVHEDVCTFVTSRWILLRMSNVSDKRCTENQNPFRKSCRFWDNVEKYGEAGQATDDNIIRRMRFAGWITKATNIHLLLFYGNNG